MFRHDPLPKIELVRHDLPTGRVYLTPEGNKYPSVTSVLGSLPNTKLDEWVAKVGEEEAKAVSSRAARRGTAIHSYVEDYICNKEPSVSMFDIDMWRKFKPVLSDINDIRLVEGRLYSDRLQLAGATDIVANWKGTPSIIDIKTSRRWKSEEDILGYFIQTSAYGCMVYERYGIEIKQVVILIAIDDNEPQVFVKQIGPYLQPLFDVIKHFRNLQGASNGILTTQAH